jgi:hypothetical protein
MLPWLVALVALVLVAVSAAAVLLWVTVELQVQVNAFYSTLGATEQLPEEVYRYWDSLSQNAYLLQQLATPILVGGVATLFALLAVLARRWDVLRGRSYRVEADAEAS